jgi:hypothetical protein
MHNMMVQVQGGSIHALLPGHQWMINIIRGKVVLHQGTLVNPLDPRLCRLQIKKSMRYAPVVRYVTSKKKNPLMGFSSNR